MNKVKAFFKKIGAYIKNTAWIQPILIVIVIFVILFSLNPLTEAIKKGWTKITTVNNMETITYEEYVSKVATNEKFVVVFTDGDTEACAPLYDSMNEFLKSSDYKNGTAGFKVYNVDVAKKSAKKKIDDKKYEQYKDKTIGLATSYTESNEAILAKDALRSLDARIELFVSYANNDYSELSGSTDGSRAYTYVAAPLFVWYENGVETRISNTWSSASNSSLTAFRKFITDFEGVKDSSDFWTERFDLVPYKG